jgi:hypothetical protein
MSSLRHWVVTRGRLFAGATEHEQAESPLPSAPVSDAGGQGQTAGPPRGLPWLCDWPRARWERGFRFGLLVLLGLLLVPLLPRVPRAYCDDSWYAMGAYTLAYEGWPREPGQMGRGDVDRYLVQPRLLPNVPCAAVFRIAGFGLTQSRAVAAAACVLFVFGVYALMRRLFGPVAAAAIAVLTAVDPWVFICGRTYRPEIFLAALLWFSWGLLLEAIDRHSAWRAFLGGLCTGLACWTHPNGVVFSLAAFVAFAVAAGAARSMRFWLPVALGGVAVGLAPYALYVAYVQISSGVNLLDQVVSRQGAWSRPILEMLRVEYRRWVNFLQLPSRLPVLLLFLWGLFYAVWRGRTAERLLLVLAVVSAVLLPLFVVVAHGRYCVILVPALTALMWRSLSGPLATATADTKPGWLARHRRCANVGVAFALLVYGIMSLGATGAVLYAHRGADYDAWVARVAAQVPAGHQVMAHTMFWIGLYDRRFISLVPPYYSDWRSDEDAVEHICRYRPEFLVQASSIYWGIEGLGPRTNDLRATHCGRACETVAARVPSRVLTEFYDRNYGAVRVWQLIWPAPDARPGASSDRKLVATASAILAAESEEPHEVAGK